MLIIRPITFQTACDFVNSHHRHHKATVGCKFCIGIFDDDRMVGVVYYKNNCKRYVLPEDMEVDDAAY